MTEVPDEVVGAWGWSPAQLAPLAGGLINATYPVRGDAGPVAVLQRLHPIFGAEVNLDLEAVTAHLAARGLTTPRLVRTRDDRAWVEHEARVARADVGRRRGGARVPDPSWAEAGGELVGRFHRAVADLAYDYRFTRAGVHDTARHLARLRDHVERAGSAAEGQRGVDAGRDLLAAGSAAEGQRGVDAGRDLLAAGSAAEGQRGVDAGRDLLAAGSAAEGQRGVDAGRDLLAAGSAAEGQRGVDAGRDLLAAGSAAEGQRGVVDLGREILAAADGLSALGDLPLRHVHGDLKLSNLLFLRAPVRGVALVDLDTLAKGTLAFELGDAMRSWCNPHGEDAGHVRFELAIFAAAIAGFAGSPIRS